MDELNDNRPQHSQGVDMKLLDAGIASDQSFPKKKENNSSMLNPFISIYQITIRNFLQDMAL